MRQSSGARQEARQRVRQRVRRLAAVLAAVLATISAGCNRPQDGDKSVQPVPSAHASVAAPSASEPEPSPAEDGRNIFVANCIGCHGRNADAATPAGRLWHVPDLRSAGVQQASDAQLLRIMREGKGKMPAWGGQLSPIDLEHVLLYLRSLKNQ